MKWLGHDFNDRTMVCVCCGLSRYEIAYREKRMLEAAMFDLDPAGAIFDMSIELRCDSGAHRFVRAE